MLRNVLTFLSHHVGVCLEKKLIEVWEPGDSSRPHELKMKPPEIC